MRAGEVRLPTRCLVVLVGASGSGKSTWAEQWFRPEQIVSSDRLRALVGEGPDDQRAGTDAFAVLDLVLDRRARRGLLTVVDTLGLDAARRAAYRDLATRHGLACHVVRFGTDAVTCRKRNKQRSRPVPAAVLSAQLKAVPTTTTVAAEGFAGVHEPGPVRVVPPALIHAPDAARRQEEDPVPLRFGLQIPRFDVFGDDPPGGLRAVTTAAEAAGFESLWVMDHLLQIPQVGREWDPMLDAWTALGFLAGASTTCRLGTLVSPVTFRPPALLGKLAATLDVLSGGRAVCGLGAGWFAREHLLYDVPFPPAGERLDRLEDTLRLLPLLWGPGGPAFEGGTLRTPEALGYPRPVRGRIPLLVGGQGERRTLRLVAQYADACNLFGAPATVRHKLDVLARHCAAADRDPAEIEVTHLSTALLAPDAAALAAHRPPRSTPEAYAEAVTAGDVTDQIGRYRELAEAGVRTAIVSLADLSPAAVAAFAPVVAAFPAGAAAGPNGA